MTQDGAPIVAIVGGGITGLTAAHTFAQEAPEVQVVLFEADERLGGKLRSVQLEGARVEAGADSFLIREPFALALCEDIGLRDELVEPAVFGGLVWDRKGARPLPPGAVMGVPTSAKNLMANRAVPLAGRLRGLGDMVLSGPLTEDDVPVGPFLRRRFGRAVMDGMVDPILAGTRAGDPDELSLRFAMPQVFNAATKHRSVMKGLRATVPQAGLRPRFRAPRLGMQQLVAALTERIQKADVRTSTSVSSVSRETGGYAIRTKDRSTSAGALLIAAPAWAAAKMLADLSPSAAKELSGFSYASAASIALAYPRDSLRFPSGSSGFLVPTNTGRFLSAGTWWSLKWPHAAERHDVVRCFVGRSGAAPALELDDEDLVRQTADEIGELLRTSTRPTATRVDRWPNGLPQYRVGHAASLGRIEAALAEHPGIELAGADHRGTGIPDCVRQGTEAARRLIRHLRDPQVESRRGNDRVVQKEGIE